MAPSKTSKPSSSVTYNIRSITKNWKIHRVHECLPRALWPNKQFEATQWDIGILTLLSQISAIPNATIQDFRAKARRAIKARQERNGTAAGKVGWVKVTDLKAVLKEYEKEIAEADAAKNTQEAEPIGEIQTEVVELPKTPVAPVVDSEEEESEQGSSEPLPGGKYQYLTHVRPLKVDLNPTASPPKKLVQAKATRGKKRQVEEEASLDPSAIERPNVVQQDPNPRAPDDTGFLSDLEPEKMKQKERKKKRLSRLEQYPVRVPHWQRNLDDVATGPLLLSNGTGVASEAVSEGTLVNGKDENEDLEMDLDNLPSISINATVKERREMEELRLRMEQRIWRIKVLRIKEREGRSNEIVGQGEIVDDVSQGEEGDAEDENDDSDEHDEIEHDENGIPGEGRVLRSRKAK